MWWKMGRHYVQLVTITFIQRKERGAVGKSYEELLRENEAFERRLRHLLASETIREYDAVDPRTKQYKKDIRELDKAMTALLPVSNDVPEFMTKTINIL